MIVGLCKCGCGRTIDVTPKPGRPRVYASRACSTRYYRATKGRKPKTYAQRREARRTRAREEARRLFAEARGAS